MTTFCENCGSKSFNLGCVNCDEQNYIDQQIVENIRDNPITNMHEIHDSEYKDYGFTDMTPEQATKRYTELEEKYDMLVNDIAVAEDRLSKETDEAIRNVLEIELQTIEKQKDIIEKEITLIKDNYVLLTEE